MDSLTKIDWLILLHCILHYVALVCFTDFAFTRIFHFLSHYTLSNSFVQNWKSFGGVYYFLLDWWSFDDQKSKHHLPTGRFHTRNINNIFCEHFLCLQTNLWPDGAKKGKKGRIGTKSWLIEQSYVKHNFLLLSDKMLRNSILSNILNTWRRRSLNFSKIRAQHCSMLVKRR